MAQLDEYGAYLSNLITVPVGTVIGLGSPGSHGGLGRFLIEGDIQIVVQGLGTLTNPVKGEGAPARSSEPTAPNRPGAARH